MSGPHTEADLQRVRMALAEIAPDAQVRLVDGYCSYPLGTLDRSIVRRASAVARLIARCDACWATGRPHPDTPCAAVGPPPYAESCDLHAPSVPYGGTQ